MTENPDGTALLTVDAVCAYAGSDAYISRQMPVRFGENGKIRYLGSRILRNGVGDIPPYQCRVGKPGQKGGTQ